MKQMTIDPKVIVHVDLTGVASLLHPVVFTEGDKYCCLLGPNPQAGVMGCGDTAEQSVSDWDDRLKERLSAGDDKDEIVQHVKKIIGNKPISDNLKEFLSRAIRPPQKRVSD
jgi:hypothetical protein